MYKPLKNKTDIHVELNPSQALPANEEKKRQEVDIEFQTNATYT